MWNNWSGSKFCKKATKVKSNNFFIKKKIPLPNKIRTQNFTQIIPKTNISKINFLKIFQTRGLIGLKILEQIKVKKYIKNF